MLLIVGLLAGFLIYQLRHGGMPVRTGEVQLEGLHGAVEVRWDRWGVPHVKASHDDDLAAALGWLHANDRLTQMEIGRRAARGRLSELLGEAAYEIDLHFRRLQLAQTADRAYQTSLSAESKSWLDAYARGIDSRVASLDGDLPPGLRLLGAEIEPWQPADSLLFALLMAHNLSFWDDRPEEKRFHWLAAFGATAVGELLGDEPLHVPTEIAALAATLERLPASEVQPASAASPGSNNWAVGGSRTATGRSLLANDPHLGLGLPSIWFQVHLHGPGYRVAGMSLPGAPGVVIGRGAHHAWALTNVMLDDHDLFFERLSDDGSQVLRGDVWLPIRESTEVIEVRGGEPRSIVLRVTDIGPLYEADAELGLPARSLAWTAHELGDPISALRRLAGVASPEEVEVAVEGFVCPAQNLVLAFETGELVYTMLGKSPARRRGDGRLPSPGWDTSYGWDGLRQRLDNPRIVRPQEDLLVTANSDIRPPGYALPLSANFFQPFRTDRIRQRLLAREDWTRAEVAALQLDTVSLFALEVTAELRRHAPFEGEAAKAWAALDGWDGTMSVTGESALFALLEKHLLAGVFDDEADAAGCEETLGHYDRLARLLRSELAETWFDDVATEAVEGRGEIFARALAAARHEGAAKWGSDVTSWDYGWLHTLTLEHALDAVPVLGGWLRRGPYEMLGSATTIPAFGAQWTEEERLDVTYGPSMRWVVDWSQPDRAFAVLPGGQSGHFLDPHYDDQIAPFLDGELHEAPWSEGQIEAATVSRLQLTP